MQGTPPFTGHQIRSRKNVHIIFVSITLVLNGHVYSGERDSFSGPGNPGLTSIQGTHWHSKSDWPQRGFIYLWINVQHSQLLKLSQGELSHLNRCNALVWIQHIKSQRLVNDDFNLCCLCWLIIKKTQPNLHSGDTSIPKGYLPRSRGCPLIIRGP